MEFSSLFGGLHDGVAGEARGAYDETLIPTAKKPLRIRLEVESRDAGFPSAEDTYRK